jgi:streptogrisin D
MNRRLLSAAAASCIATFTIVVTAPPAATAAAVARTCAHSVPAATSATATTTDSADKAAAAVTQVTGIADDALRLTTPTAGVAVLPPGLENGVLGVLASGDGRFTVVVDARRTSPSALSGRLRAALPDVATASLTVEASCASSTELARAWRTVLGRAWHPSAATVSFAASVEASTETVDVTVDPAHASPEVLAAIRGVAPGLVDVRVGSVARTSRTADQEYHKGGARITRGNALCTSGFVVRRSDGVVGATTASHCGPAGGDYWYSGPYAYGRATTRTDYPRYDVMLLINGRYAPYIYTDGPGDSVDVRTIQGAANPAIGQLLCISGQTTRAHCSNRVENLGGSICDADGCTTGLIQMIRADGWTVQPGDSGGPVYTISSTAAGHAVARGSVVGVRDGRSFAEAWSSISGHLGVTIATL